MKYNISVSSSLREIREMPYLEKLYTLKRYEYVRKKFESQNTNAKLLIISDYSNYTILLADTCIGSIIVLVT